MASCLIRVQPSPSGIRFLFLLWWRLESSWPLPCDEGWPVALLVGARHGFHRLKFSLKINYSITFKQVIKWYWPLQKNTTPCFYSFEKHNINFGHQDDQQHVDFIIFVKQSTGYKHSYIRAHSKNVRKHTLPAPMSMACYRILRPTKLPQIVSHHNLLVIDGYVTYY